MAGLFEEVNTNKPISRGSLVAFQYPYSQSLDPNIIHDPSPLILITDIWPRHIRGVNLHYLTFPYIKKILQGHCEHAGFSYGQIRGEICGRGVPDVCPDGDADDEAIRLCLVVRFVEYCSKLLP